MLDKYPPPDKQKRRMKSTSFEPVAQRVLTALVQKKISGSKAFVDAFLAKA